MARNVTMVYREIPLCPQCLTERTPIHVRTSKRESDGSYVRERVCRDCGLEYDEIWELPDLSSWEFDTRIIEPNDTNLGD